MADLSLAPALGDDNHFFPPNPPRLHPPPKQILAGTAAVDACAVERVAPSRPDVIEELEGGGLVAGEVEEERAVDHPRHRLLHTRYAPVAHLGRSAHEVSRKLIL